MLLLLYSGDLNLTDEDTEALGGACLRSQSQASEGHPGDVPTPLPIPGPALPSSSFLTLDSFLLPYLPIRPPVPSSFLGEDLSGFPYLLGPAGLALTPSVYQPGRLGSTSAHPAGLQPHRPRGCEWMVRCRPRGRHVNPRSYSWGGICTPQTCFCVSLKPTPWVRPQMALTTLSRLTGLQPSLWPLPSLASVTLPSAPGTSCQSLLSPPGPTSHLRFLCRGSLSCLKPTQLSGLILKSLPKGSLLYLQTHQVPLTWALCPSPAQPTPLMAAVTSTH